MSDEVESLLYNDPYYGLGLENSDGTKNYSNYIHWDNLVETEDAAKKQA